MQKLTLGAILAASTLAVPTVASGLCAMASWSPQLVTPRNQSVPKTGGVLVTAVQTSSFNRNNRPRGPHPSMVPLWIQRGQRKVELRAERLAPGLSRYVPRVPVRGTWTLVGLDGAPTVRFSPGAGAALPAPRVHAIKTHQRSYRGRRGNLTRYYASAEFSGNVPTSVVGVIVYTQGPKLAPSLFRRVPAGAWSGSAKQTVQLYESPGRCSSDVAGTRRPSLGQTVRLRWVDRAGQLSPLSKPVRVTAR